MKLLIMVPYLIMLLKLIDERERPKAVKLTLNSRFLTMDGSYREQNRRNGDL